MGFLASAPFPTRSVEKSRVYADQWLRSGFGSEVLLIDSEVVRPAGEKGVVMRSGGGWGVALGGISRFQ